MRPVTCLICHFRYTPPDEVAEHRRRHREYVTASAALGHAPDGDEGSAERYTIGQQLLGNPHLAAEQRLRGLLLMYRALYDRLLLAAIRAGTWDEAPSFETFVAATDLDDRCREIEGGPAIYAQLRERYPRTAVHLRRSASGSPLVWTARPRRLPETD